ncbi:MAG TPA: LPS export ABC transporter permease LptG [Desulfomonilaceae bacterium]|nr:LPS export ABC transporter permease LptG [Desulfomonilaceae bacterium]
MRILDRYITSEFLKVFTICLMGFVLVFLLVEVTDKIKYYFEYNPPGRVMLKYFLVKLPGYLFFAIPLAILMGGMLSLLMMARHSEIIAMQANGVDALSVARPVLRVGLCASLIMFVADETVIPWSNSYSEYIQNVEIAGKKETTFFKKDQIWMRSPDSIAHIRKFEKKTQMLEGISIVRWDRDYNFLERLFADKAKWWNDHWIFYGINRIFRSPDGRFQVENLPSMSGPLNKAPSDFDKVEKPAKEMNLIQLDEYIEKLLDEGQLPTRYLVDWHDKIAFPLVCLIMAALSVPFAIKVSPRGGGIAAGLGLSLLVAFSFWIVHTMFIALGHGGLIPPIAAAWGANVIFGFTAMMLVLQAGT